MAKESSNRKKDEPVWEVVNPAHDAARERLGALAWLLDAAVRIPGTRIRFGLDALLGLLPGIGDAAGAVVSTYILAEAAALGVPKTTLVRMGFNVAIEAVIGLVPLAGDLFDVAWKANLRNVRLLNRWMDHPTRTARASRIFVAALVIALILFVVLLGAVAAWAIAQVVSQL